MHFIIGPVTSSLVSFFFLLSLVQAQYSQDYRTAKSFQSIRFPDTTRPRTQLIKPQPHRQQQQQPQQQLFNPAAQQQFRPASQQFSQPTRAAQDTEVFPGLTGKAPRDEATQSAALNVAQFAVNTQNGGEDSKGKALHKQSVNQPKAKTQFLTNKPPQGGVPRDDVFSFGDSRFIRLTPELQEQRDIADQQEFLLLQGTSAKFLNRKTNSQEYRDTLIEPEQGLGPAGIHEGFRSLPLQQPHQASPYQYQTSQVPAAYPASDPYAQPAPAYPQGQYQTTPYQAEPYPVAPAAYPQAAPVSYPPAAYPPAAPAPYPAAEPYSPYPASPYQSSSYSYESYPGRGAEVAGFNYGYDVYHG